MKEMNLGRILIENRHKRGITQDELAAHIGVSKGAVSKWETGVSQRSCHFSHDPDRQNADDSIEAHCLDDIFPFSEECSQYCNQHNKRKLVCERRGEHGR